MKKCAPILIPTLCRDIHFIRLIESLKLNTWAKYTDVFIGLDYPPSEKYMEGYRRICEYLEGDFCQFKSFNVIRRHKNYGSRENMEDLKSLVFKTYDRFIRTDDDAEFSPNFLEYMNKCLDEYEDDPNVIAVTGYSYPIEWNVSGNATIFKENFICPMWGTGFWRDKYIKVYNYIVKEKRLGQEIDNVISSGVIDNMLDVAKCEFVNLCMSPDYENTLASQMSDISIRMYTAIHDKYIIKPTVSKVRNWGFDGTGMFCPKTSKKSNGKITAYNYEYALQQIDISSNFELIEDVLNDNEFNRIQMNRFDPLSPKANIKMKVKIMLFCILGEKRFHKFTRFIRQFKENE